MGMCGNVFCLHQAGTWHFGTVPVRFKDRNVYLRSDAGDQMPAGIETAPNSTLAEGVDEACEARKPILHCLAAQYLR